MKQHRSRHRRSSAGLAILLIAASSCSTKADPPVAAQPAAQSAVAPPAALPLIPAGARLVAITARDKVCMVNDQYMGRAQIPVEVGGRTYFGCCKMCKERLEVDARLRAAIDPVSGLPVDKASASIGMLASGDVLYFESDDNLEVYAARSSEL